MFVTAVFVETRIKAKHSKIEKWQVTTMETMFFLLIGNF